ncbi:hypothetical protein TNCV_2334071 [Trichonephila clavipes]|nr:hypothetical protein TNCV_2334071 [Trichonephila clavipes]
MELSTNTEQVDMHLIYGSTEKNLLAAERCAAKGNHREMRWTTRRLLICTEICVNMNHYDVIDIIRVVYGFQRATVSHTKCFGYRSKESEYYVLSSSHSWHALTMHITS